MSSFESNFPAFSFLSEHRKTRKTKPQIPLRKKGEPQGNSAFVLMVAKTKSKKSIRLYPVWLLL